MSASDRETLLAAYEAAVSGTFETGVHHVLIGVVNRITGQRYKTFDAAKAKAEELLGY